MEMFFIAPTNRAMAQTLGFFLLMVTNQYLTMLGAQLPWFSHHLYIFQEWPGGRWKPILETTAIFYPTPGFLFLFECTLDSDYYLTFSIGQIMIELRARQLWNWECVEES